MKNKHSKNTSILKKVSIIILVCLQLFIQIHVSAAEKWYFVDGKNVVQGSYNSEVECWAAAQNFPDGYLSSCYKEGDGPAPKENTPVNLPPAKESVINKGTYKLLAPIGDFKEIQTDGTGTCPGNEDMKSGLGCYLNILFKIGIGVCGVLAVIMIVVGGIQYMGQDSVFGKVEAKQKIFAALFGLLIALGAFALLNTIDPNLTGKGGVKVDQVSAIIIEPEVNDYTPEQASTILDNYKNSKGSFSTSTPGPTSIPDNSPGLLYMLGSKKVVNQVAPIIERNGLKKVKAIIMHGTTSGNNNTNVKATFVNARGNTGAHFSIDRNGVIWQLARITTYTNHFRPNGKVPISNSNTIGIELVEKHTCTNLTRNKKFCLDYGHWEGVTDQQVSSTKELLKYLISEFKLDQGGKDVYGHGEVGLDRTPTEGLEAIKRSGFCPAPCRIK